MVKHIFIVNAQDDTKLTLNFTDWLKLFSLPVLRWERDVSQGARFANLWIRATDLSVVVQQLLAQLDISQLQLFVFCGWYDSKSEDMEVTQLWEQSHATAKMKWKVFIIIINYHHNWQAVFLMSGTICRKLKLQWKVHYCIWYDDQIMFIFCLFYWKPRWK